MFLIFDTETTGVPRDYKAPLTDLKNWSRVVQLAWLLTDEAGQELSAAEHIIRPEGFRIPQEAAAIHGISTQRALDEGIPLPDALDSFSADLERATTLAAHNMGFDEKILGAEFLRLGRSNPLEAMPRLCTMHGSTEFCRIPGRYGFKWPRLDELHFKLFGEGFSGAHTALADVRACARCLFELRRLGVM